VIITSALELGFKDPALLFSLLWHAPHGEARHNPEKRDYLQALVKAACNRQAGGAPLPELPARILGGTWPQKPATQSAQDVLDMFSGSQPADPGQNVRESTPPLNLDQSVSGQFFQLLAGLGEKVIMESCRYEAMVNGVRHQAGEIDNLVSQWEQHFAGSSPNLPSQGEGPTETTVEFSWDAIAGQNSDKKPHIQAIQAAAGDFLNHNPDLAGDRHKVQMVVFCLKNYISINPENAALPFREKLDQAGIMAREFFRKQGEA